MQSSDHYKTISVLIAVLAIIPGTHGVFEQGVLNAQ